MEIMLAEIGRRRLLVPVPFWAASVQAAIIESACKVLVPLVLSAPPLTRDQVRLLRRDNVVSPAAEGLVTLGVGPTALELIVPTYLRRYRRGGRRSASDGASAA